MGSEDWAHGPGNEVFMSWYEESVFYQIYPLGLCDAPWQNDGVHCDRISKLQGWIPHLQRIGVNASTFHRSLRATPMATTPGTTPKLTAAWGTMHPSRSVPRCTRRVSGWCWTGCSTMSARVLGVQDLLKTGSPPPMRAGFISALRAIVPTMTACGTRAGRATMIW